MRRFACWILGLDFFVRRIILGPNSVLVLKASVPISVEAAERIRRLFERVLPGVKVLILGREVSFDAIIDQHKAQGILTQPGEKLP